MLLFENIYKCLKLRLFLQTRSSMKPSFDFENTQLENIFHSLGKHYLFVSELMTSLSTHLSSFRSWMYSTLSWLSSLDSLLALSQWSSAVRSIERISFESLDRWSSISVFISDIWWDTISSQQAYVIV